MREERRDERGEEGWEEKRERKKIDKKEEKMRGKRLEWKISGRTKGGGQSCTAMAYACPSLSLGTCTSANCTKRCYLVLVLFSDL